MRRLTLRDAGIGLASLVGIYAVMLGALLTPNIQRFAVYAHKFNTLFIHDLDRPEQFGFAEGQVTPFHIETPDGETLYAWHVLPVDVYARNERVLLDERRSNEAVKDFTKTKAFQLLTSTEAKLVKVHGNAGHLAQGWRPDTFRYVTTQPNTHLITIDYRGFGKSTGHPTERGLITDGTTLVNWALKTANIPPERIVLLGQSLGTAVASAVALRFASPFNDLIPRIEETTKTEAATVFAGVILVAPFSSLPSLLLTYRIGGMFPILLPLRPFPRLASHLTSLMVDKWPTAERLAAYYSTLSKTPAITRVANRNIGSIQIFHSLNDMDISYHQSEMVCERMLGEDAKCISGDAGAVVLEIREAERMRARFELLSHGGHNRVITYSPIAVAVARAFEDFATDMDVIHSELIQVLEKDNYKGKNDRV